MITIACCLVVWLGLGLGLDLVSVWLVVMHTYLYYFTSSMSHYREMFRRYPVLRFRRIGQKLHHWSSPGIHAMRWRRRWLNPPLLSSPPRRSPIHSHSWHQWSAVGDNFLLSWSHLVAAVNRPADWLNALLLVQLLSNTVCSARSGIDVGLQLLTCFLVKPVTIGHRITASLIVFELKLESLLPDLFQDALFHHHHQEHAPSWSVAVSSVRFHRSRSWARLAYFE